MDARATRRLLLLSAVLLLGAASAKAAPATTRLQGPGWLAGFRAGMLVELKNRLTGETLVIPGSAGGTATGVRRSRELVTATVGARTAPRLSGRGGRVQAVWPGGERLSQTATAEGNALVIRQTAAVGAAPLVGVQWALGVVPPSVAVLVPGNSGLRFGPGAPDGDWSFEYPVGWEAQFVLLQGKRGGFLIWSDDQAGRFKTLWLNRRAGRARLAFETRADAPFSAVERLRSVTWRVQPYQGSWLEGARLYREWAEQAYGLAAIRARRPAWMARIRCVVIAPLDRALLEDLAQRLQPAETLLYVPHWRRDGYDRNYPDYTAVPEFGPWCERARALGFRVMPHVNYFGCDPLNPLYEQFRAQQIRDPFTHEPQWWLWDRADPPIKFAYINPASRAWRQLFVSRMKELCARYPIDALHLDQTLCIFNDHNGRIDGMNCLQGNLALHRELCAALPNVALSGEGLDEVTYRYEAFAQRHLHGLNHADGDWSDRLIALAHPISSAIFTPHTTLYGYLGMANPTGAGLYQAWRRGYDHFGIIPTLAHLDRRQLQEEGELLAPFFAEAVFFQRTQAVPDFTAPWPDGVLFRYRLANGGRADLVRDRGVVLKAVLPDGRSTEVYRRVEGVSTAALPGSIPGWQAYDEERLLGLDPAQSYTYRSEPRDLQAFHITRLPATAVVRHTGVRGDLAAISLGDRDAEVARLWDFGGPAEGGVRLFDGTERRYPSAFFGDPSGGNSTPESGGIFLHPPWRFTARDTRAGIDRAQGIGVSFVEFRVKLPNRPRIRFEAGVCLRDGAIGKSDGATFRASAWPATTRQAPLTAEVHNDGGEPRPLRLDLSALRGQEAVIRLETHPGPRGEATFDWALIRQPRVVAESQAPQAVVVHSPKRVVAALGPAGPLPVTAAGADRYEIRMPLPGTARLLLAEPPETELPLDLITAPRLVALVGANGIEQPPSGFAQAVPAEATVGGVTRRALSTHPPNHGRIVVDYILRLPETPARLEAQVGIRDGSASKGVGFAVEVNGGPHWVAHLLPGHPWQPVQVDLSRFAGQVVVLSLVADSLGTYEFDWAVWAEPKIVAR